MIRITKIDENFSIFKENKVVLWGSGDWGQQMLKWFQYFNLDVFAFCDNNEILWGGTL